MSERKVDVFEEGIAKAIIYYNHGLNEYRVAFHVNGRKVRNADYYTDDERDARGTARQMVKNRANG